MTTIKKDFFPPFPRHLEAGDPLPLGKDTPCTTRITTCLTRIRRIGLWDASVVAPATEPQTGCRSHLILGRRDGDQKIGLKLAVIESPLNEATLREILSPRLAAMAANHPLKQELSVHFTPEDVEYVLFFTWPLLPKTIEPLLEGASLMVDRFFDKHRLSFPRRLWFLWGEIPKRYLIQITPDQRSQVNASGINKHILPPQHDPLRDGALNSTSLRIALLEKASPSPPRTSKAGSLPISGVIIGSGPIEQAPSMTSPQKKRGRKPKPKPAKDFIPKTISPHERPNAVNNIISKIGASGFEGLINSLNITGSPRMKEGQSTLFFCRYDKGTTTGHAWLDVNDPLRENENTIRLTLILKSKRLYISIAHGPKSNDLLVAWWEHMAKRPLQNIAELSLIAARGDCKLSERFVSEKGFSSLTPDYFKDHPVEEEAPKLWAVRRVFDPELNPDPDEIHVIGKVKIKTQPDKTQHKTIEKLFVLTQEEASQTGPFQETWGPGRKNPMLDVENFHIVLRKIDGKYTVTRSSGKKASFITPLSPLPFLHYDFYQVRDAILVSKDLNQAAKSLGVETESLSRWFHRKLPLEWKAMMPDIPKRCW